MGGKRSLVVLCAVAALIAGSTGPQGQLLETVDVNIINQNFDPAEIRVVDEVCDVVAFEGEVLPNATVTVSLCPDQGQRGDMIIYDATGRARRYSDLRGSNVYLQMR